MFEIHVTVENADEATFARLCRKQKAHPILIELPKTAKHYEQLMCSKWVTGDFNDALKAASEFSKAARENNFTPIREKIEQPLSYAPDDFVPSKSKGEYWEFHYKLHLANREEGENLHSKILNADQWKKNARMSKSALREKANDGGIYRIVTLRLYDGDKAHAKGKCDELKAWLTSNGCNVIKIQKEISVYDDYLELDQGWL